MGFGTGFGRRQRLGLANITTGYRSPEFGSHAAIFECFANLCCTECVSALVSELAEVPISRRLGSHNCARVDQGRCWLAVGLRGVDEGLDSG